MINFLNNNVGTYLKFAGIVCEFFIPLHNNEMILGKYKLKEMLFLRSMYEFNFAIYFRGCLREALHRAGGKPSLYKFKNDSVSLTASAIKSS